MADLDAEQECRVCRCGSEDNKPLYTPCLCSGSIGLVHQECLEAWLAHSKKDACELCNSKYQFTAEYAPDTPASPPLVVVTKSLFSIIIFKLIPFVVRFVCGLITWIVCVPLALTMVYCGSIGRTTFSLHGSIIGWEASVKTGITTGLVLAAVVAVSLLILLSFTDFLRFHWAPNPENGADPGNNVAAVPNMNGRRGMNRRRRAVRRNPRFAHPRDRAAAGNNVDGGAGGQAPIPVANHEAEGVEEPPRGVVDPHGMGDVVNDDAIGGGEEVGQDPAAEAAQPGEPAADDPLAADAAANVDGENGGGEDDDDMQLGADELQEVGVEIRVALLELLGVEGAFHVMFRNAAWLLAFVSLYIVIMGAFPYALGRMATAAVHNKLRAVTAALVPDLVVPTVVLDGLPVVQLLRLVWERSAAQGAPLQFFDFAYMGCGYGTVCLGVAALRLVGLGVQRLKLPGVFQSFVALSEQLAVVVKVGFLLVTRIFLLPLCLGSVVVGIAARTVLSHCSLEDWAALAATNAVGFYAVVWVAGITFMLTMTISVLQMREVLHPSFLARLIRPQEGHNELIASLVVDSATAHARRVLTSGTVYIILMLLFLYAPMLLYRHLSGLPALQAWRLADMFRVKVWYLLPQLQLPLEMLVCHVSFLSLLDRRKDIIGHMQHRWLVFACRQLGLTRFLLPLPAIVKPKITDVREADGGSSSPTAYDPSTDRATATTAPAAVTERDEDVEVGPPLVRPPEGWEKRGPNKSSRWAWGTEQLSDVEAGVAPRVAPRFWLLRCAVLALASWALVCSVTLGLLIVPLGLGRLLFFMGQCPAWMQHDPLCFLMGCALCASVALSVPKDISAASVLQHVASLKLMPTSISLKVSKIIAMWLITEASVGFLVAFVSNPLVAVTAEEAAQLTTGWTLFAVLKVWVRGALALETCLALLFSQSAGTLFIRLFGLNDRLLHWRVAVERVLGEIKATWFQEPPAQWTLQSLPLDDIEQLLVRPLFNNIVLHGAAPVFGLALLFGTDRSSSGSNILDVLGSPLFVRNMRVLTLALCGYWLAVLSYFPARKVAVDLRRRIMDDTYLVGRKLVNSVQAAVSTAPPTA